MNYVQFVSEMITDEHVSGEFMISSAVQHAIVQLLIDLDTPVDEQAIVRAVDLVMEGLDLTGVVWNGFLVGEAVRGFIHGLTSLGISPDSAAKISVKAVIAHFKRRAENVLDYVSSITTGILDAGEDLGLKTWQVRNMVAAIPFDGIWNVKYKEVLMDEEVELNYFLRDASIRLRNTYLKN